MKVGVSYNVFDGEELLEGSIECIRKHVDFISIVYQKKSNFGNDCDPNLVSFLESLKERGLVDELFEYKPKINQGGHTNEIMKRNIGLFLSEGAKCTHHMSMDTDEYYDEKQFIFMCKIIEEEDYDSAACQLITYYKDSKYRLDPMEDYYVSLIYKISQGKTFVGGHPFPVLVDPTRRMNPGNCKIFTREEIEMHHLSYVRKNIKIKLTNSSASPNFQSIDKIVNYFNNWEYGKQALMGGAPDKFYDIKEVEDKFKVKI